MEDGLKIDYLGWSGFHIHNHKDINVFIDPPRKTSFMNGENIIFISHGHPEHLGGTLDYVKDKSSQQPTTIIASKNVCSYLKHHCQRDYVNFINVRSLERRILTPTISFEAFKWSHMPLLPPGIGAALGHLWQLIKGYRTAWRIIKMSLGGPFGAGEMLGYVLKFKNDQNIIIYGEGLHRNCNLKDVKAIGDKAKGSTLLVAAEPEDSEELPDLINTSGAQRVILYEPHGLWRDIFKLPHIDLKALKNTLTKGGIKAEIAHKI